MVAEGPPPASKDADSGIRSHPVDGSDEDNSNVIMEALQGSVQLLEEAVKQKETRLVTGRILRQTAAIRKQLDAVNLQRFVRETLPESLPARADLLQHLEKVGAGAGSMEMDGDSGVDGPDSHLAATASPLPEVEMFNYLLVIIFLIDSKADEQAKALTTAAVARLGDFNRRTLDVLAARIYFYYSWTYEKTDALVDIRGKLMELHRTAVLRHDDVGQETLLNLLLRSYLHYNLYDQAEKLRSKVNLPEVSHSNQQYCRYLFYLGRIRAIRLEYTDAKDCLTQAARKAPSVALGFRIAVNKWLVLIHLLLGEIPQRTDFTQRGMATALLPYLHLTLAVRSGDLHDFQRVQEKYAKQFVRDRTQTLVVRLHHNVIRTGLKRITLAYSRISLEVVAARLGLPAVEDAECIVAKAIRDGGIDAWLDHENSCLHSQQQQDVYSTAEPLQSFHERIAFCLDVHNEAVKAMRYQPDEHRSKLQNAQDRMGMEQAMDYLADAEDDF